MTRILILTKNVLHEVSFEKQLRHLGNEVFTSLTIFENIMYDQLPGDFLSMFHQVIISETIDNKETVRLINKLRKLSIILLRKTNECLEENRRLEWKELGLTDWVECHPTLETLRDQLICDQIEMQDNAFLHHPAKKSIDILSLPLSAGESRLLMILYQHQKVFTSREDLCVEMWSKPKTNSTMSQLSTLVSKLKRKLEEFGVWGEIIETSWGQGYRLAEQTYQQLYIEPPYELLVHECN